MLFPVSVLLLSACTAASTASTAATPDLKTFRGSSVLYEPHDQELLDLDFMDQYDAGGPSSRVRRLNRTRVLGGLSPEALLFLSGPVSTVFIPSFYTLVFLVSIPINVCAVVAFARGIRPKKPAAIFMLNLAVADLLLAAMLPFKISYHFRGNDWRFGGLLCRAVTAAFYWNMYCSVLLIAGISVDRLLAVVYPIRSLTWRRPQNAALACALMWASSLAGSVPLVVSEHAVFLPELNVTTCHDVQDAGGEARLKVYFLFLCGALFFLPLLVTLASYARVLWSLCGVPKGVSGSSRRRRRAVVMALTVLLIFLLCFLPTNSLLLAHYLMVDAAGAESGGGGGAPDGSYAAYLVFLCVGSLNCVLDPLVYYFGSSQCQRTLSRMLRCQNIKGSSPSSSGSSSSCRSSSRTFVKSVRSETEAGAADSGAPPPGHAHSNYRKLLV